MNEKQNDVKTDVISGRNPVSEAIRGSRPIDKILIAPRKARLSQRRLNPSGYHRLCSRQGLLHC